MKRIFLFVSFCASLWPFISGAALSDATLAALTFDQKLGSQIPTPLAFRDENGGVVQLGSYFNKKPVLLVLGYYQCPMLCGLVLNGMTESMQDLRWSVGKEYEVINISIDPSETAGLASAKKRACLKRYGRDQAVAGWHFLTGDESSIKQVAAAVGFQYAYDAESKQYAHPSGFVVLTPDGHISKYFLGVTFSARDLQASLAAASNRSVGSRIQDLVLLCFHYRPITSKYGAAIMLTVRTLGIATVFSLGFLMVKMSNPNGANHAPSPDTKRR
jgi:protein SCO1/2